MNVTQAIYNPFGINVFGSSTIRVAPDIASLTFSVSRITQKPRDAFQEVREGAQKVNEFLSTMKLNDVSSSRVTLGESVEYRNGESHFMGYLASVTFNVLVQNLDQIEDILVGVIDAGVNHVASVDLQTTQLKEVRADARRRAVKAAQEKAENYCVTAGVKLGSVIHIEDVSPDRVNERSGHVHISQEATPDDDETVRAIDPGSIIVSAAVLLAYQIEKLP